MKKSHIGAAVLVAFLVGVWVGSADQIGNESPSDSTGDKQLEAVDLTTTTTTTVTTSRTDTSTTMEQGSTTDDVSIPLGWTLATVVEVVDGDTLVVKLEDGAIEPLRLIGTNSPEDGECFATEATQGLVQLVLGEIVGLEPDVSDRDQFNRLLRYVWTTDGDLVNQVTIERGWAIARDYPPDIGRSDQLTAAHDGAAQRRVGLWAPDACGAASSSGIDVTHVEYDAPGDDSLNLNEEWVEISNTSGAPVDVTGWVLKDESASHRFRFPDAFVLQPGEPVRIFSGCGENSAASLYWCNTGSAIWNNSGDTAFLLDPSGNIADSYSY